MEQYIQGQSRDLVDQAYTKFVSALKFCSVWFSYQYLVLFVWQELPLNNAMCPNAVHELIVNLNGVSWPEAEEMFTLIKLIVHFG